ncbi:hypothetical protein [Rhodococcus jostii]|uniref:hypothetical protein n=1 Tax=Rhodococcus jostii TaxID=132919 RepID=UPI0011D0EF90|nr:hypothetical protein [Rhodococcus jostii]
MHGRLAAPLAEWYAALDRLDPGRVIDRFPLELDTAMLPPSRSNRHDRDLLDSLIDELPAL